MARIGIPELIAELPQPMELTEAEWMARHPLGFVEQREAFSPKGEYGKWLRGHNVLAEDWRSDLLARRHPSGPGQDES